MDIVKKTSFDGSNTQQYVSGNYNFLPYSKSKVEVPKVTHNFCPYDQNSKISRPICH
jgi:hypothetical protein